MTAPDVPIHEIRSTARPLASFAREYLQYRDLLFFFVWRDFKVRFYHTLLGIAWAVLVPVTQMLIFGVIFGKVAKLPSNGIDPFVFYLCALVPWQYFAAALTSSSQSLVSQSHLLTKVYFPRLFIPVGSCLASGVDFAVALLLLLTVLGFGGFAPGASLVWVPVLWLLMFTTAVGAGTGLSALAVRYRDVRFVVPFLVQVWMYASVLLPFSALPEDWGVWRYAYALNPMVGIIEGFRWTFLEAQMIEATPPWSLLALGLPATVLFAYAGLAYFHRVERKFADAV